MSKLNFLHEAEKINLCWQVVIPPGKYYFSLLSDYNNDDDDGGGGRVNPSGQKYFNLAQSQPSYINLKINALDTKVISNIDFLIMVGRRFDNQEGRLLLRFCSQEGL